MTLRPCPYCGSEMIGNMTSPICRNPKCEFCDIPIPLQYVEDMHKLRNAITAHGISRNIADTTMSAFIKDIPTKR